MCEYVRNAGNDHNCATCSRYGKAGYGSNAWEVFRVFKCTKPATPGTTTTQAVATTTVPGVLVLVDNRPGSTTTANCACCLSQNGPVTCRQLLVCACWCTHHVGYVAATIRVYCVGQARTTCVRRPEFNVAASAVAQRATTVDGVGARKTLTYIGRSSRCHVAVPATRRVTVH